MSQLSTFPILEREEILICMRELGCTISEDALQNPAPEQITRIMEQLLDLFMGFNAEENAQIKFAGMDVFDHPEIHEYSVGQLAFYRALMRLMASAGIQDFQLKDLFKPEPKRIIRIFSAVINFAKFREEKVAAFQEYVKNTESLQIEKQHVDAQFERLTEQLHFLRAQREQEQPLIVEVQQDNERMQDEIRRLNGEQGTLKTKIHDLKQQRQTLSDKRDRDQFALLNLRAEISKLQALIVKSPERVKREMADMSSTLESDRELLKEMDARAQTLRSKVDGLHKTERDVAKLLLQLKEVEETIARYKAARKEVKRLQACVQEGEGAAREQEAKEQSLRRQAESASTRASELESRHRLKLEAAEREMDMWRQRQLGVEKENMHIQNQVNKLEEEARTAEKGLAELAALDSAEAAKILAERAKVEEEVRAYNRRILAAISD